MKPNLSHKVRQQEKSLLKHCKEFSGEYLNNLNKGRSPHATTYSYEFCDGAADLIKLYQNHKVPKPKELLSQQFISNKIYSCRGHEMDITKVNYLYTKFLAGRVSKNGYAVLNNLTKELCPICKQWKTNLKAHVQAAHETK